MARSLYNVREKKKWDLVIDLRNSLLSRLIRKRQIIRYNDSSDKIHKVESYCKLIGLKKAYPLLFLRIILIKRLLII